MIRLNFQWIVRQWFKNSCNGWEENWNHPLGE